jgi:hypothetical protein
MKNIYCSFMLLFIFSLTTNLSVAQNADIPINPNVTFNGEQSLAIDPVNPNHLVAAWMKYHLAPAPAGMVIATSSSTNGGLNWSNPVEIIHFRTHWVSADPTLVFKNDGTVYLGYIDYKSSFDSGAVYITRSTNGGTSWGVSNKVIDYFDNADLAIDRPWMAIDNSGGAFNGNLYMVTKSLKTDPLPHHIYMMRSTNGGVNWSVPLQVDNPVPVGPTSKAMGVPAVTKSGKLLIGYASINPPAQPAFVTAVSLNGGAALTNSVIISAPYTSTITNDTLLQLSYNLSANPTNSSNLVFVYSDKNNGDYDVYGINTNDEGLTWSAAVRITSDAISNGNNQDMVWANFSNTGKYATLWRDRRANSGAQNQPYKIWGSYSVNGGNNFSPNFQLSQTDGPLMIPVDANDFLGCALNDSIVYSTWTDKRNNSTNQLFINKYKMPIVTGIAANQKNNLKDKIFPNPNNGSFTIEFNNQNGKEKKVEIADMNGKIVYSSKTNLSQLNIKLNEDKGNYIVRITEGDELRALNLLME